MTVKERIEKATAFAYLVTKLGKTQKEAAGIVGISERVACEWVKEYKLKAGMQQIQRDMKAKPWKYDQSLSAFMAYARIHYGDLLPLLEPVYKKYLETL